MVLLPSPIFLPERFAIFQNTGPIGFANSGRSVSIRGILLAQEAEDWRRIPLHYGNSHRLSDPGNLLLGHNRGRSGKLQEEVGNNTQAVPHKQDLARELNP